MSSIFSTQNLQTFLRRKNLRPPPPSRGGPPGPRPPPPNRGRSPPGRGPSDRGLSLDVECSGAFVSSAIILLCMRRQYSDAHSLVVPFKKTLVIPSGARNLLLPA